MARLVKNKTGNRHKFRCSFCERPHTRVQAMITNNHVKICNDCLMDSLAIINKEIPTFALNNFAKLSKLMTMVLNNSVNATLGDISLADFLKEHQVLKDNQPLAKEIKLSLILDLVAQRLRTATSLVKTLMDLHNQHAMAREQANQTQGEAERMANIHERQKLGADRLLENIKRLEKQLRNQLSN